jgi:hypothetical protein
MFKRTLMTVLAVSLLATPAAAQSIGFKLGMTSSTIDGSDEDNISFDRLTSLGVGGFLRFGPLQIDVLGMTKGSEVTDPTDGDFDVKIDYVEVPVQFVLGLGSSRLSPYLMVGPSVAFEVGCSAEAEDTAGNEVEADCDDSDIFPDRKEMDFGLSGAAGLQIPMGPGAVLLEGRYTHGLSNIFDDDDTTTTDFKIRNRAFGLFVGYSIGLGR